MDTRSLPQWAAAEAFGTDDSTPDLATETFFAGHLLRNTATPRKVIRRVRGAVRHAARRAAGNAALMEVVNTAEDDAKVAADVLAATLRDEANKGFVPNYHEYVAAFDRVADVLAVLAELVTDPVVLESQLADARYCTQRLLGTLGAIESALRVFFPIAEGKRPTHFVEVTRWRDNPWWLVPRGAEDRGHWPEYKGTDSSYGHQFPPDRKTSF